MKLKDFFKKLANKKDIKRDANNNWAIKFNSKKLVLLKEDDGSLKIAIVACKQTKNMIKLLARFRAKLLSWSNEQQQILRAKTHMSCIIKIEK